MIDMNAIIEFEDIVLMKKRISQRLNLSPEQFRLSWRRDTIEFIEDHFVFELNAFLYGQELGTTVVLEVETYETWFDHWLDTSCPRWSRNFFVVKKKKITKSENVDFDVLYQNFYPARGKDEEYVVVRRTKR